jgi:hypothetical protein
MTTTTYELAATTVQTQDKPEPSPEFTVKEVTMADLTAFINALDQYTTAALTWTTRSDLEGQLETDVDNHLAGLSGYSGPAAVVCVNSQPVQNVWQPSSSLYVYPGEDLATSTPAIVVAKDASNNWYQASVLASPQS